MTRPHPPRGALAVATLLVGLAALWATVSPAGAQAQRLRAPALVQSTETSIPAPAPPLPSTSEPSNLESPTLPRIIPLPNSGQAPNDAGDRGGWLQVSLFWFILAALAILGLLVYRDGRRNKRKAAARAARRQEAATGPTA